MHRSTSRIAGLAPTGTLVAVLFCLTGQTHAQITGIATTNDGSVLYFATPFNLAGSPGSPSTKIYTYDSSGVRLYADQFPDAKSGISSKPWVSGDGSVVAYGGVFYLDQCGIKPCHIATYLTAVQTGSAEPVILNGSAIISANARFAVMYPGPVLLDLTTGAQTPIPRQSAYGDLLLSVASDGTVLLSDLAFHSLWI